MPQYKILKSAFTPVYREEVIDADSLKEAIDKAESNKGTWTLTSTEEQIDLSEDLLHECELESITDEQGIEHPAYELLLNHSSPTDG